MTFTDKVPQGGETYQANAFETHIGGKGLNQTIALAKLNPNKLENQIRMIGNVGDDAFGNELISSLKAQNVNVDNVHINKNKSSGVAVILVEESTGENRILITPGANAETNYDEQQLLKMFSDNDNANEVVVFQHEVPGTINTIKWLNKTFPKKEIVYNPSPYHSYASEVISLVDTLIVNETESLSIAKDILPADEFNNFKQLTEQNPVDGFKQLATSLLKKIRQSHQNTVIITLGSLGAVYTSSTVTSPEFINSVKIDKVVDTTGAGDTFLGSITTQIYSNVQLPKAMQFSTLASSFAVQEKGASNSIPNYEKVANAL